MMKNAASPGLRVMVLGRARAVEKCVKYFAYRARAARWRGLYCLPVERALLLAESLSHPPSIVYGHAVAGRTFIIIRDRRGCERMGARCVALAEKFDLPYFRWYGQYLMGWAKAQGLTLSEGLASMEEAFPHLANEQSYKFLGAALAEARFNAGRVMDALALVDHAVNTGEGPASGLFAPEIHRLWGVFLSTYSSGPVSPRPGKLRTELRPCYFAESQREIGFPKST